MKNILIYGNCQSYSISQTLNLSNKYYNITMIICFNTNIIEKDFLKIINNSDIIITQSINNNYRDKYYLSTSYILEHCSKLCKVIIYDSCYFNFYHFDLTYKYNKDCIINKPCDYHYTNMIDYYKNNKSKKDYLLNIVNNKNFKSSTELENIANKSIEELKKRYNLNQNKYSKIRNDIYIISTYDFIKDNYKKKLLFYSINHPSKYIFHFICNSILKYLNIESKMNYDVDLLSHLRCIIYKCIQNVVEFDISKYEPKLNNLSNNEEIINLYFDKYKEYELKF